MELIEQQRQQHEREINAKDELITELRQDTTRLQDEIDRLRVP